ncbi:MAG: extracellular solute-binding protein [Planctomycetes bacterium]|nr:extracellular solute-binding protein [Planctomycetota bacterium]
MFSRVNSFWMILGVSIVLVGGLAALMLWKEGPQHDEILILHCAAALKEPIDEIIPLYESQKKVKIEVRYGKSHTLLTNLALSHDADVFLPADDSYIKEATEKNLLNDVYPLATMNATLVVNPGFNKSVNAWSDLLQKDKMLAVANPGAAIARLTIAHLGPTRWQQLHPHCVEMGEVTQVGLAVKTDKNIDAGIIWDAMLASPNYQMLKAVKIPELEGITATVKIGVVKKSTHPIAAQAFAQFVSAGCGDILAKHGFKVTSAAKPEPPKTSEKTVITVYAGSMLRPAIDETLKEFEQSEGVTINRVYNGCGILVSAMKTQEPTDRPDLYFSCDPTFMNQVESLFDRSKVISKNQLVIAVPKGNPHGIKSLKDLGKEGLKVGVGHEQQCALGLITQNVLIRSKTLKAVEGNIVVRSPSGDLLVNQLLTGSLDAVVAYVTNVKPNEDKLDAIKVEEVNCAPLQPIAISKETKHPELVKRLVKAIESAQSKERFEKSGFGWELQP